jgi:hypothetical protein
MFVSALLLSLALQDTVVVANPAPKPERKICRTTESTGSRMGGSRICRTASEWKVVNGESADAEMLNESVNSAGFNSGPIQTREPTSAVGR